MKKTMMVLLALALLCACAAAEAIELAGCWTAEYLGIPLLCLIYGDHTFEAVITESLPVDEMNCTGTWTFDGTTLTLQSESGESALTWDGEALNGELFGLPVALQQETFEGAQIQKAPDPEPPTGLRALDDYDVVATPEEMNDEELLNMN